MATSITEAIMNELFSDIIAQSRKQKKVVVACIEKEAHQVGGKMVADVFEKNGWDAFYLGANTPIDELIQFCKSTQPDLISLSLTVYMNLSFLIRELATIQSSLDIPILIGGQGLRNKGQEIAAKLDKVQYFANLYELENHIRGDK